jgi:hypothetical protein
LPNSQFLHPRDWPASQLSDTTAASTTRYRSDANGLVPTGLDRGGSSSTRTRSVRQPNHLRSFAAGTPTAVYTRRDRSSIIIGPFPFDSPCSV